MWLYLYSGIAGLAYLPATQPHLRAASFTPRAALFFPRPHNIRTFGAHFSRIEFGRVAWRLPGLPWAFRPPGAGFPATVWDQMWDRRNGSNGTARFCWG